MKTKTHFELNAKTPKGTCALCGEPCPPEYVLHYACGIAYTDEKLRRARLNDS